MSLVRTSPILVPPPPRPPVGIATDAGEPEPERRAAAEMRMRKLEGFLHDACHELRCIVWPEPALTCAQTMVTIVLVAATACYLSGLGVLVRGVLRSCGIEF